MSGLVNMFGPTHNENPYYAPFIKRHLEKMNLVPLGGWDLSVICPSQGDKLGGHYNKVLGL